MSAVIVEVVEQHAEEAAFLWTQRSRAVSQPHYALRHLARLDERVAAHLDGLAIAYDMKAQLWLAPAAAEEPGTVFSRAVLALTVGDGTMWSELLKSASEKEHVAEKELISALGWVSAQHLRGVVKALLDSQSPFERRIGVTACAMHRVDPGAALGSGVSDPDPILRARSYRTVGEIGRLDLFNACWNGLHDENPEVKFWAAWATVLLRDRGQALDVLSSFCAQPGPFRERAMQLALRAMDLKATHSFLQRIAKDPKDIRTLIQGAGIVGDPNYLPWLIKQMADPALSRLAGESLSLITGLDLAYLDLDGKPPENFDTGPTDDPEDENVAMDPDGDLPWPDADKIQVWWEANRHRFQNGIRYFMGEPVTAETCKRVLREGFQHQRLAAALFLSLLQPGTPLFNTAAPAWRQQRLLEKQ